jgi:hypothetical protein
MNGQRESGRGPIVGRIAGGLLLLCGLTAAVALDWRPMHSRDIGDRVGPPRRPVAEPRLALPARIEQCERYTVEICGTWTLQANGTYRAAWDDGATATIRVMELSGSGIVAARVDDEPRRLTAVYEGTITGRQLVYSGSVRWTAGHDSHAGSWTARWDPDLHPGRGDPLRAKHD